jgi:hypothetical protein
LQENHNIALDKVLEVQAAYKSLEDRNVELQKQILKLQHETISKVMRTLILLVLWHGFLMCSVTTGKCNVEAQIRVRSIKSKRDGT